MAFTEDDLTAIDDAIKKGARRVRFKDSEVEYHSLKEMLQVRKLIQRELGVTSKTRRVVPAFSKGLECEDDE